MIDQAPPFLSPGGALVASPNASLSGVRRYEHLAFEKFRELAKEQIRHIPPEALSSGSWLDAITNPYVDHNGKITE